MTAVPHRLSVVLALSCTLGLSACGAERGPREAPSVVSYGGWVYDSPLFEAVFSTGALTFTVPTEVAPEGEPVSAAQPYEDYAGYWLATLPPSVPFELRVEGEGAYPTVWAGDTPGANGTWFPGALFAGNIAYVDALVASLDLPLGVVPGTLAGGAVHLWGTPLDGTAWDCAVVTVNAGPVHCYVVAEDGTLARVADGPFDVFFAFDLAPGEIELLDGFGGREAWTAEPGDLVMAWWVVRG